MSKPSLNFHPSLESSSPSLTETTKLRPSLFNTKDDFIERVAPLGMAAIYFGGFSLAPQDVPLSRQALFKLSFLYRHFLQPAGLRIVVNRQTAILSGTIAHRALVTMADILALQIEGIRHVKNDTEGHASEPTPIEAARESTQFLFATDQTLRSGVHVTALAGALILQGEVSSIAQKKWAEQLAESAGAEVQSKLKVTETTSFAVPATEPLQLDDESLEALVMFRLRLTRETEHLPLRVKAVRGVVSLTGKVRTEALRQRAENIARSTLGLKELRSTLSLAE